MISRRIAKHRTGRGLITGLATTGLIAGLLTFSGTALAINPSTTGLFELDTSTTVPPCPVTTPATTICGNANTADSPAGGADDWANVYKSATGLGTASADHAFARTFITDPVSGAENSFYTGGGSKDVNDIPQWQFGTSNDPVPDKDDIANLFAAAYTDSGSGHTIIYFGMDRYDNNGDAETGFWFFKNTVSLDSTGHFTGVHSIGDVLVLANWGGSNPVGDITVYSWIGGKSPLKLEADNAAGDCALAGTSANFCAVVNRTNDTPQWPFLDKSASTSIRPLELFEAGLDLNALFGSDRCFSSFLGATRSSHSPTAQLKDFALGNFEQCSADLSTSPSTGAGGTVTPGTSVTDTATVTAHGGANPPPPTGSVTFYICGPIATGTCDAPAGTQVGSPVALSNSNPATATSAAFDTTGQTPGRYCFRATWPGDTNYPGVLNHSGTGDSECFNIAKQPSHTDTLSSPNGDIAVGDSVSDTATVTGSGPTPTGTVDFFLCQPSEVTAGGCVTGGTKIGVTKTLSAAGVATSDSSTNTNTVGKYCWRAEYSGDGFYLSSSHTDSTNECFTVKDTTSATSAQDWLPNDSATITSTGGTALSGSLSFTLYSGTTCGGTILRAAETFTIASASPVTRTTTNTTFKVLTTKDVSWLVEFTSSNPLVGSSSHCESTSLTITN